MGRLGHCFLAIAGVVGFSGAANASAELFTSAFFTNDAAQLECVIANVSDKHRNVTISLLEVGAVVGTSEELLVPGGVAYLKGDGTCADPCRFYCRFEVEGSNHDFRASLCLADPTVGISCLPAE